MHIQWFGQSSFRLDAGGASVFIDPFGDISGLSARGLQFDYPPIEGVDADLVLVTHEHVDHNAVERIGGTPTVLRSTAGRLESPIGEVLAVASEHDAVAGTERGPNTIFVFTLGGIRVAHFGDFGQAGLREEQASAIGSVDLLFVPVGGRPTIGAEQAGAIADRLGARWVVPMHYRTPRVNFLEPLDDLLERLPKAHRVDAPAFDLDELPETDGPLLVVPAAP
jgi:L-ascorbate metabolism protein UlaG (beta-lactamase superfamily)